ncbi:MAG: helix-turn-helix transcriptional regulator [Thermaceae bacterium]|nr:helix-turn-helix transcriptional regulator [Thermaceae bacterium]
MESHATFWDAGNSVRADSCEPLKSAAKRGEVGLSAWGHGLYPGHALPQKALPEVRSAGVWTAARRQNWGLGSHCNEGIEFSLISKGKLGYEVGDKSWLLHPGHLTITRPWQYHRVGNPLVDAGQFHWLILDVGVRRPNQEWRWPDWLLWSQQDLERLTVLLRHNDNPVWRANAGIIRCFERIHAVLKLENYVQVVARLKLHVNELLIEVLELLGGEQIPLDESLISSQHTVRVFLQGLPEQLGQDWTLDAMGRACGLGRTQFARYCQEITGMTPIEYLTFVRLETAARLLHKHPHRPITEIAFSCGFGSSQYFANSFRTHKGCTPREYRQAQFEELPG